VQRTNEYNVDSPENIISFFSAGAVLVLARWEAMGATIPGGGGAQYAAELRILYATLFVKKTAHK